MNLKKFALGLLPRAARYLPFLWDVVAIAQLYLTAKRERRECPCCGQRSYFRLAGTPPRLDALCPVCMSRERHRLIHRFLSSNSHIYEGCVLLHFAPERTLRGFLEPRTSRYVACDYAPKSGEVFANIEALDFPDSHFDTVICSHVLEHVDDSKALRELRRVMKPGGAALLLFPIVEGWEKTYEDASARTERERFLAFGQKDHVRFYGRDVRDRIHSAGLYVEEFTAEEPDVRRFGLLRGEKIFICFKPMD